MLGGASLPPRRVVPKLVSAVPSVGSIPLLLRGDSSVQEPVMLVHSVTVARIAPGGIGRTSCYADRPRWPRSTGTGLLTLPQRIHTTNSCAACVS